MGRFVFDKQAKKNLLYYYCYLVKDFYDSWGKDKDKHNPSIARFNIIAKTKNNDFERTLEFGNDLQGLENKIYSEDISNYLGLIFKNIGHYSNSLHYLTNALKIYEGFDDRINMALYIVVWDKY